MSIQELRKKRVFNSLFVDIEPKDLGRVSYPDSDPVFLPGSGFQISLDQYPDPDPRHNSVQKVLLIIFQDKILNYD